MKIETKFNQLTYQRYINFIENRHRYTNFNTLGLYRSIVENKKLDLTAKIAVRKLAHEHFLNFFEFLQLKDPLTYLKVSTLGQTLTVAEERQLWKNIINNQEQILKEKRIKHRNFGACSKHICGVEGCPYDGVMIHQNSRRYKQMCFTSDDSDENNYSKQLKVERQQAEKREFRDAQIELSDDFMTDNYL